MACPDSRGMPAPRPVAAGTARRARTAHEYDPPTSTRPRLPELKRAVRPLESSPGHAHPAPRPAPRALRQALAPPPPAAGTTPSCSAGVSTSPHANPSIYPRKPSLYPAYSMAKPPRPALLRPLAAARLPRAPGTSYHQTISLPAAASLIRAYPHANKAYRQLFPCPNPCRNAPAVRS
jgi:hypothetical protein